jgi:hypothetical protein
MTEALYIGNASKLNLDFQYCVERGSAVQPCAPRSQPIPPGTQIRISGELSSDQIDHILRQHAKYGLVASASIDQSKGFHGTCYSIGKPITGMRLALLMKQNHAALIVRGREIREQSAVAQSGLLETTLAEQGRPETLTQMDLTIQEEEHDPNNIEPQLSEGFRVVRGDGDQRPPARRGRSRAA